MDFPAVPVASACLVPKYDHTLSLALLQICRPRGLFSRVRCFCDRFPEGDDLLAGGETSVNAFYGQARTLKHSHFVFFSRSGRLKPSRCTHATVKVQLQEAPKF